MRIISLDTSTDNKAPRNTYCAYGPTGSGKCVVGDTRVLAPDGRYERIDDIVRWGKYQTLSVGEAGLGGLRGTEPSHYHDMGISKIFEMVLADGRTLRGTPEHPVLTTDGYIPLAQLGEGDEVVVSDSLPYFGAVEPENWEPELLAYLIADGGLTEGTPSFTKKDPKHRDRFVHLVECAGDSIWVTPPRRGKVDSIRLVGGKVKEWLSDLGLWGRPSRKKFVPAGVFTWERGSIAAFLSTLFTCDGHLAVSPVEGRKYPVVDLGYSSSSRRLLDDVAHLLRRFEIRSRSRYVKGMLNGVEHGGYALHVGGLAATARFIQVIGIDRPNAKEIAEQALERLLQTPSNDRGLFRDGLRVESVRSIVACGEARVFDLTIPGVRNFLANDIVVHNTTWAASFPRPVFLSETTESGYESLRGLADEMLFEAGVKPIVLGIEKMNDMAIAREVLTPHIASGMVQTVVKDSLTFYADLYLNYLFAIHAASAGANLKAYGALGQHLRDLRVKWHQMGCNVVSLCLAQDPDEGKPNGLPSIPGKEANKYGASCDYLLYLRRDRFKQGQTFVDNFEIHSKPYGPYVARARRAVGMPELASPLVNTNYAGFIEALGYDVEATRAALPPYRDPAPEIMRAIAATASTQVQVPAAMATSAATAPVARHVPTAAAKPHVPTAARAAAQPTVSRRPAVSAGRPGNNS